MKILTFINQNQSQRLGLLVNGNIYDVNNSHASLPNNMLEFLNSGEKGMDEMRNLERLILEGKIESTSLSYEEKILTAPITNPTSCRDGYAFRQLVASARRNRCVPMIP